MKKTSKYGLTYFEKGDFTSSIPEMQRWETLDNQLYSLFNIIGNGVLTGWDIIESDGLSVVITPGSGHVSFVSVATTVNTTVPLTGSATNYIYASLTVDSYWTQKVTFLSSVSENTNDNVLLVGIVTTNANTATDINTDDRTVLGFVGLVNSVVKAHRHIGGTTNPPQVNLATDVQGVLNQANIPDLDADVIQTGTIDPDRLPIISHVTGLKDQGILTHSQLDDFVNTLSLPDQTTMGEVSTTNLLQLILALKHIYPDIDQYLVNEIAFIPGISPDSYVDTLNTTANVNTVSHTITGTSSTGFTDYVRIWDSNEDFENGSLDQTIVNGDSVLLDIIENTQVVDSFVDVNSWHIETVNLSAVPANLTLLSPVGSGAELDILDQNVNIILKIYKSLSLPQNWSSYNYLKFYINTDSVQHGDLFFYINDNTYGIQNSYTNVLPRNAPTIDQDTLQNGWQEVILDLTPYNRNTIKEIGFYVSTQSGWDTAKGFSFQMKDIYLSSGNVYLEDGHIYLTFGSDFYYKFTQIRWDAIIPSDSESDGVLLEVRARFKNDGDWGSWTNYLTTTPYDLSNFIEAATLYKNIQMDFYFTASDSLKRSAVLRKVLLDFQATDVDSSFDYSNKVSWDTGYQYNIDTTSVANSMTISGISDIGSIYYGTTGSASQVDDTFSLIRKVTGSLLPRSTYQVINDLPPSLGTITGVVRGNDGNFLLSDIDNDRIVEMDISGSLVRGFMGSFITPPQLSANAVSNVSSSINVLHSIYNQAEGVLYIICDNDLENIYNPLASLNLDNLYIKVGGHRIYLNDSTVELLGVSEEKKNLWESVANFVAAGNSSSKTIMNLNEKLSKFTFDSHVLKITPNGADKTLMDYLIDQEMPSVIIASPLQQEKKSNLANVVVNLLTYNFELGTTTGEPFIKLTVDGTPSNVYSKTIDLGLLSSGDHTLKAELCNAAGYAYTNMEAVANATFVANSSSYALPYLYFTTPCANQIYSSSPVEIEFVMNNFAVVPNGQHVRYVVDSEVPVDYYSTNPILLEDLDAGKHTITIYTVDQKGNTLSYPYGSASVDFIVGLNSNAIPKLYVDNNAIYSKGQAPCPQTRMNVDVANMSLRNIYSPVDLQLILPEDNTPNIMVAKLESLSWADCLGSNAHATEITNRLVNEVSPNKVALNSLFDGIATENLIYENGFADGQSIVEFDIDGNVIFSNDDAVFAPTKELAVDLLGSCEKTSDTELLIGDAYNKRAIIVNTDLTTKDSTIQWEYDSDRYVSDFHLAMQDDILINVSNSSIDITDLSIREGMVVTWVNNSDDIIQIYSGTTSTALFNQNPDLNLYGDKFYSSNVAVGNSYSVTFNSTDVIDWFVYPLIETSEMMGQITITSHRLSDRDQYYILENDMMESPFTSRVIKVDSYGNLLFSFGEGYLVKPRDIRSLSNSRVIIST